MKQTFRRTHLEIACLLMDTAISIYRKTNKSAEIRVCRCSVKRAVMQLQQQKENNYACIRFLHEGEATNVYVNLSYIQKKFNE